MNSKINYNKQELDEYLNDLQIVGSLSSLFSESKIPLLHYRVPENLYCSLFGAENLARADVSADAKLRTYGIGIKTFLEKNKNTYQKIAEFNGQSELYKNLPPEDKIRKIAELRNRRIMFTKDVYNLNHMIYHCVVRNENGFFLFEENMNLINTDKITLECSNAHIYKFHDDLAEYQFNESKSTLYKRFKTDNYFASISVEILENPMELLRKLYVPDKAPVKPERLMIPLYTYDNNMKKVVAKKSGLNQWNASGRKRSPDEVYIPYPKEIRSFKENFFPDRNTPFDVELPNGKIISMKVCQDGGKALMSNPNKALGKWLLRDILKIKEGVLLTYEMLLEIGIDAIAFEKTNGKYKLNFVKVGKFEEFRNYELNQEYE